MLHTCKSIGCPVSISSTLDFCPDCEKLSAAVSQGVFDFDSENTDLVPLLKRHVRNSKPVKKIKDMDVFAIHQLFEIYDFSGCIQQASSKLLMSSNNTTRKPRAQDIRDARDILTRWLELNTAEQ